MSARERDQDAAITRLREGLRTQSQRDEAALLRDWIKARRLRASRGLKAVGAAAPDRPALVACGRTVGRSAATIPVAGRAGRPTNSEPAP